MRTDHGAPVVRIEFRHEIHLSYRTHGPIRSVGAGSVDCAIAKYSTSQTVKSATAVIVETFRICADRMDASRLDSSGSTSIVLDRPVAETCG